MIFLLSDATRPRIAESLAPFASGYVFHDHSTLAPTPYSAMQLIPSPMAPPIPANSTSGFASPPHEVVESISTISNLMITLDFVNSGGIFCSKIRTDFADFPILMRVSSCACNLFQVVAALMVSVSDIGHEKRGIPPYRRTCKNQLTCMST